MSYKLLQVSQLSALGVLGGNYLNYPLYKDDLFMGTVGTETGVLSTVKVTLEEFTQGMYSNGNTTSPWISAGIASLRRVYAPNHRVGIGTSWADEYPYATLTVHGGVSSSEGLSAAPTRAGFRNVLMGNVGIGTNSFGTSETYMLNVVGNTNVTGNVTIGGNTDITGNLTVGGDVDSGADTSTTDTLTFKSRIDSNIEPSANSTYDLGTTALRWSKLWVDTMQITGNVDIDGDLDVDGTTNLDVVDIDGAVQIDATVTVGVDDTGYDVKFFGATSDKYTLWDQSLDKLIVLGTAKVSGQVSIGDTIVPNCALDIGIEHTNALKLPVGNRTQRPANGAGSTAGNIVSAGMIRFNSQDIQFEGYDGTNWGSLGGVIDVDQDTYISAEDNPGDDNNEIDFFIGVLDSPELQMTLDNGVLYPAVDDNVALGKTDKRWSHIYTQDLTVSDALVVTGNADFNGDLDVDGTTNLDVVDIDGAVDMALTLTLAGNADFNGDLDVDGTTNLDVVDIDGAVDMALTLTLAGNADFNGDLDVDGTTNLDAVDIDGAVQIDAAVTVGVDDTGHNVKFFGAAASHYLLWDQAADDLVLAGATSTISIDSTVDATNTTSGSFHTDGGVGIAKKLYVGTNLDVGGTLTIGGGATHTGGVQVNNSFTVGVDDTGHDVKFYGATASHYLLWDQSEDDLVLAGATSTISIDSTVDATNTTSGSFHTDGGVGIAKKLYVGTDLDVDGTSNLDVVDIDGAVDMASTLTLAGNADFNGQLDVSGTTNLDVVDIDGAVDMASTLTLAGHADFNSTLNVQGETTLQTHLNMGDGDIIKLGASADLQIFHNGSHSYVQDTGTGSLVLAGTQLYLQNGDADENFLACTDDGAVQIYYDNAVKLATVTGGITVTGDVTSSDQFINTVSTGTPPLVVSSTTNVPNLNVGMLGDKKLWANGDNWDCVPYTNGSGTTYVGNGLAFRNSNVGTGDAVTLHDNASTGELYIDSGTSKRIYHTGDFTWDEKKAAHAWCTFTQASNGTVHKRDSFNIDAVTQPSSYYFEAAYTNAASNVYPSVVSQYRPTPQSSAHPDNTQWSPSPRGPYLMDSTEGDNSTHVRMKILLGVHAHAAQDGDEWSYMTVGNLYDLGSDAVEVCFISYS